MNYVISRTEMVHVGGTKSYTIVAISNVDNGHALLITRWGKIGQFGQMKVERCFTDRIGAMVTKPDDTINAKMALKLNAKIKNGYTPSPTRTITVDTSNDVASNINAYWFYLGKDNAKFLCGSDLTAEALNKITRPDVISTTSITEEIVVGAPPPEPEPSREEIVKHNVTINANWGMF